ncbi:MULTISPECIES: hypothetical protein [unclassified Marinovum]|uniref:hypothetical protein n=1 Tax=unclassified Marinovum TaxID=2647166 RepID=UPI003EDBC95E
MKAPVVIYVNGGYQQDGPAQRVQTSGALPDFPHAAHAEILTQGQVFDPHREAREFPDRWQKYIRAHFRDYASIQQAFGVCERTARKWFDGETGARGAHVAMALRQHGREAWDMLIGEQAA